MTDEKYDGPDVCVYHADCHDGMTAAWAIWRRWGDRVRYVPARYGNPGAVFDAIREAMDMHPSGSTPGHVLFVDFSLTRAELRAIADFFHSVTVLDHHKTAEEDLREFCNEQFMSESFDGFFALNNPAIRARFDMNKSGARLAWEFAHPGQNAPDIVTYVEDRDLWRFAYTGTKPVHAWLASVPQEMTAWNRACNRLSDLSGRQEIMVIGRLLIGQQERLTRDVMRATKRKMTIGGFSVPVFNLPFGLVSDGLNDFLYREYHYEDGGNKPESSFAASYCDTPEGRVFSLRSTDDRVDVSEIAKKYGGGGHRNAAGFRVPLGWEGDDCRTGFRMPPGAERDDASVDIYTEYAAKRGITREQAKEDILRQSYSEVLHTRRVRHKKRGTTYRVLGEAILQASAAQTDNALMVVYRAEENGTLWVRPKGEFEDGRFEDA